MGEWHEYVSSGLFGWDRSRCAWLGCGQRADHPVHQPAKQPATDCCPKGLPCRHAQQPAGPDVRAERSSVGQDTNTFESAVDTAAIRTRAEHTPAGRSFVRRAEVIALCDALDARDAEIKRLREAVNSAYLQRDAQQIRANRADAEIRELRARLKEADGHTAQAALRALNARAKLEEIRALCDDQSVAGWTDDTRMFSANEIRAILDQEQP